METKEQNIEQKEKRFNRFRRFKEQNKSENKPEIKPHIKTPIHGKVIITPPIQSKTLNTEHKIEKSQHHNRPLISIVIPLLNEEGSLKELVEKIKTAMQKLGGNYEIIFIDDGSTDNSFNVLKTLKQQNRRINVIRFRRNYGKSAALMVGFKKAAGEFVVTMDADLQDDPNEIPELHKKIKIGFDVVSGWKRKRYDPLSKTIPSKFFNWVTKIMTGVKIHDFNCGLKIYRSDVVKSVNIYGELHRYIPVLAHWQGFRISELAVQHHKRKFGVTKFGASRFVRGFLDLITVLFTTRYITRPLHLFGVWGMVSFLIGIGIDAVLIMEWFLGLTSLGNRPLFLVGLILIIVGVQFISLGLLGELIVKGQQKETEYSIKENL